MSSSIVLLTVTLADLTTFLLLLILLFLLLALASESEKLIYGELLCC